MAGVRRNSYGEFRSAGRGAKSQASTRPVSRPKTADASSNCRNELANTPMLIAGQELTDRVAGHSGTGGARKARAARGGRGKSGGARIIYYVVTRKGVLYLLDVYAKSAKEDLTDAEKQEVRKLVAAIEAQA
jgi:hypothetical protein